MTKRISTNGMSHSEWLALRKNGIGGSDAGAICGLNPYSSPMSVYYEKTQNETEDYDNEAMRQGRDLEDYVARRFTEETGKKVRRSNMMYWSEAHPFMYANVDRLIVGEDAGLECKTASPYSEDKWKDGKIPEHYQLQCHHYMAVTGASTWYLAVVILGREFKFCEVKRDETLINDLIQIEKNFWNDHVNKRIMPEPDGSQICDEIIRKYYPTAEQETTILPVDFNAKLERRMELLQLMERMQTEQRAIEQEIKLYMKNNNLAFNEQYRIAWNEVETLRLDTKRLKQERPEVYEEYAYKSHSRRFSVRAA